MSKQPSWRDELPVHEAAEMFPLLSETDPAALKELGEDIKKHGLTSPIVLWSDGKSPAQLLDGRNRLDAIEIAIGRPVIIGPPSLTAGKDFLASNKVITLDRSVDPYAYVISANIRRRHLKPEEKRKLIGDALKAMPESSDRQVGNLLMADHKTVGRVRKEKQRRGEVPHVDAIIDTRGRRQPTKKKTARTRVSSAAKAEAEALAAREAQAQAAQDVGPGSVAEAERLRVRVDEQANENSAAHEGKPRAAERGRRAEGFLCRMVANAAEARAH